MTRTGCILVYRRHCCCEAGKVKENKDSIIPVHTVCLSGWAVEEWLSSTFISERTSYIVCYIELSFCISATWSEADR